jgi:UDP-glucose 4-epimerase
MRRNETPRQDFSPLRERNQKIGCVVTGAAGFVGSHLAERLLAEDYHVIGVDNFFSGRKENLTSLLGHPDFSFFERSVTEAGLLGDLTGQYPDLQCCFHLAAIVSVPYSVDHPETAMRVNYEATVDLLREAERLGFRAFVFAGSSAEYGEERRLPLREEYATASTRHLSAYGRSKYLASGEVAASRYGLALRCFNIYGPRQDPTSPYSGVISRFVTMALQRQPLTLFGDGLQTRDFIYVSDVVEAYLRAVNLVKKSPKAQPNRYNIGMGKSTSILELAETINGLVENHAGLAFCPERPGDIRFSVASVDAFRQAAGWEPQVSLREGLRRTIAWAGALQKAILQP